MHINMIETFFCSAGTKVYAVRAEQDLCATCVHEQERTHTTCMAMRIYSSCRTLFLICYTKFSVHEPRIIDEFSEAVCDD